MCVEYLYRSELDLRNVVERYQRGDHVTFGPGGTVSFHRGRMPSTIQEESDPSINSSIEGAIIRPIPGRSCLGWRRNDSQRPASDPLPSQSRLSTEEENNHQNILFTGPEEACIPGRDYPRWRNLDQPEDVMDRPLSQKPQQSQEVDDPYYQNLSAIEDPSNAANEGDSNLTGGIGSDASQNVDDSSSCTSGKSKTISKGISEVSLVEEDSQQGTSQGSSKPSDTTEVDPVLAGALVVPPVETSNIGTGSVLHSAEESPSKKKRRYLPKVKRGLKRSASAVVEDSKQLLKSLDAIQSD